jgi:hypothetical protein
LRFELNRVFFAQIKIFFHIQKMLQVGTSLKLEADRIVELEKEKANDTMELYVDVWKNGLAENLAVALSTNELKMQNPDRRYSLTIAMPDSVPRKYAYGLWYQHARAMERKLAKLHDFRKVNIQAPTDDGDTIACFLCCPCFHWCAWYKPYHPYRNTEHYRVTV